MHEIYFEESGNRPVGSDSSARRPGGSDSKERRFFHPEKYRIVNFDQSTPYAFLEASNTCDLVADIQ